MNYQKILEKAIRTAVAGGWELPFEGQVKSVDLVMSTLPNTDQQIPIIRIGVGSEYLYMSINDMIFNHKFAKALWGERGKLSSELRGWKKDIPDLELPKVNKGWKYHLRQMVIADDPIQYLGENI